MNTYPSNFLWGASTAAHQVEGNNVNSDFWLMENTIQPSNSRLGINRLPQAIPIWSG